MSVGLLVLARWKVGCVIDGFWVLGSDLLELGKLGFLFLFIFWASTEQRFGSKGLRESTGWYSRSMMVGDDERVWGQMGFVGWD